MNIAVNLRQYFQGQIGGMENYVRHVVGGLDRHQKTQATTLTIFVSKNEVENVRGFAPGARIVPLSGSAIVQIESELESGAYDLFFCPLLVLEPLRPPIASAVTIPDLQHEYYPEFFAPDILAWRKQNFGPSVAVADVVFTISEHSKETIVEKLGISADKVIVVYLDVDPEFREPSTPEAAAAFEALHLPANYIYYPANFWPHKNHNNLLAALKLLVTGRPELHLALTGARHGAAEVKKEIARLGLREHVRLLEYQDRAVVAEIYRHARALAFISKFEGFGIPILEAFHAGTPVVCSASCSCPEVAGDAAILVNEHSPEAIAAGIRRVLEDSALAQDLIVKGKERAQRYSWKHAIETSIDTLMRIPGLHTTGSHRTPAQVEVESYPVVSITTPSYNMARFLEETIESVLGQDYPHIEYTVMDGGSTDGSLEILNKYAGRLCYESHPDRGQSDAINRGFAASRGQVFTYLNADDTYLPGAIGKAVRHLTRNPHAGMVYGDAYYTDEAGKVIADYPTHAPDIAYLNRNCYICQPASFLWRHAFENAGRMNVDQHYALDYDLWMRLVKLYPIVKIDEYLATSRMYGENKTLGKRRQCYQEILQSVKTHFGYVPFDWTCGYASFLLNRKAQFFEVVQPTRAHYITSLILGLYYNKTQLRRYWNEWVAAIGIGKGFEERWPDGWISKRFCKHYEIATDCNRVRISGKHWGEFSRPVALTILLDGKVVGRKSLKHRGPFEVELVCPAAVRGKNCRFEIRANRTFRPVQTGDHRDLSCIIDEVIFQAE